MVDVGTRSGTGLNCNSWHPGGTCQAWADGRWPASRTKAIDLVGFGSGLTRLDRRLPLYVVYLPFSPQVGGQLRPDRDLLVDPGGYAAFRHAEAPPRVPHRDVPQLVDRDSKTASGASLLPLIRASAVLFGATLRFSV